MITWITTIGWSPFAVINPIWAYCKENEEYPDKVVLIYTPLTRIRNNLRICIRYISEILKSYNKNILAKDSIIKEEIENESIELYADRLKRIIEREQKLKPDKIILDMTPGRKYMSAINVYYGNNQSEIPIQVLYLHLEESRYQNLAYPLAPIIQHDLINILESTEIFSKDFNKDQISEEGDEIINAIDNLDEKKDYLALLSIHKNFNTKSKMRKFCSGYGINVRGHELDKILKGFTTDNYLKSEFIINNNQKYPIYELTSKGKIFLNELKNNYKLKVS